MALKKSQKSLKNGLAKNGDILILKMLKSLARSAVGICQLVYADQ